MFARIDVYTVMDQLHTRVVLFSCDTLQGVLEPLGQGSVTSEVPRETGSAWDVLCLGIDDAHQLVHDLHEAATRQLPSAPATQYGS